jgi:hypothetical protein
MTKHLLMGAALLTLVGCEHGVDLEGTVIAPVAVQQLFSTEAPGQLFVVATVPTLNEIRDVRSVFCVPATEDRHIAVSGFDFGCAPAGVAQVSAYAVPRTTAQIDCSGSGAVRPQPNTFGPEAFDPAEALATATVEVPVTGGGDGSCADGRINFTLTLAIPSTD